MVQTTRQILLRNSESTDGKSATYPQTIRANVFVIPITDISNGAWDFSMPCTKVKLELIE
jgi:hypothetical protein